MSKIDSIRRFLYGMGRVLDVGGVERKKDLYIRDDIEAVKKDWQQVGEDLKCGSVLDVKEK